MGAISLGGLGQLIGGGAALYGAFTSGKRADESRAFSAHQAQLDRDFQREFAQHGISWRVADAKRAGLHPLAVLGANVTSAQPSYVGADPGAAVRERGIGKGIDAMLQMAVIEGQYWRGQVEKERALAMRDARVLGAGIENAGGGVRVYPPVKTYPLGSLPGHSLQKRPLRVDPRVNMPAYIVIRGGDGKERYIRNPDSGMEEFGQIEHAWDLMREPMFYSKPRARFGDWKFHRRD